LLSTCRGRLTGQVRNSFQRWGQPGQQQGRRIPSLSSVRTRSMCCLLVSGLLTEMTQQIHSLRASGVISSHFARAAGSEMRTFRKSAGTACTAPRETALLVMDFSLYPTGVVLVRVVGNPSLIGKVRFPRHPPVMPPQACEDSNFPHADFRGNLHTSGLFVIPPSIKMLAVGSSGHS